ncbi:MULTISPECIES: hypothetical protein [Rhizobium]|uniref:Uncharacterized protein n=1 Tax=Rhizobium favelukesii TaxID=348824 RepID=W6S2M2_9HYPH|nr:MULTISPECIES: hypothetical protein [Rhizobium]MCA0807184.1 hypothetical protein [Rhizobium sp. T1473]MCS0460292.1 hypothetical protein [Rhizobium favelukesii]UFS85395.1 hypothetical protein LPB79_37875 [Rhizobium sp. T136]CDM60651.1 hypothetical protein LPU83_pLPU83c_0089 [Rhizobium favelukesii]
MTNFRAKGFNGKNLDSYLAEYDDPGVEETVDAAEDDDMDAGQKEIAWLRKEVADLRERLSVIRGETGGIPAAKDRARPWLRIAATAAATFILGKAFHRLRLGAAGAAAIPRITPQLARKLW